MLISSRRNCEVDALNAVVTFSCGFTDLKRFAINFSECMALCMIFLHLQLRISNHSQHKILTKILSFAIKLFYKDLQNWWKMNNPLISNKHKSKHWNLFVIRTNSNRTHQIQNCIDGCHSHQNSGWVKKNHSNKFVSLSS